MQPAPRRHPRHICEHADCNKQTKAIFCNDHLPTCRRCGKKCRKVDPLIHDINNVFCFKHSDYLRNRTRDYVAKHREKKRARDAALKEIIITAWNGTSDRTVAAYREIHEGLIRDDNWLEFLDWIKYNYDPIIGARLDVYQQACRELEDMQTLQEIEEYKSEKIEILKDMITKDSQLPEETYKDALSETILKMFISNQDQDYLNLIMDYYDQMFPDLD